VLVSGVRSFGNLWITASHERKIRTGAASRVTDCPLTVICPILARWMIRGR
jgi:hypothetical protein